MQISVLDIMRIFDAEEKTIYEWIAKKGMPCIKVNEQYRFNYIELLEWALENKMVLTTDILALGERESTQSEVLAEALKWGGIYYDVPGKTREEVLENVVNLLVFPAEVDKKSLLEMLIAREIMESTAIGNGIALPHLRNPVILNIDEPFAALCFLKNAVDFNAFDREPVSVLFVLISPSTKMHLLLMSRLSFCLQDSGFKKYLRIKASKKELIAETIIIESRLVLQRKASDGKSVEKRGMT
ncbi:MAG: PTS sugar transporter subunit IIA [Chlamydiae bacterium]|nr:PTS sugar transporter subunit IIA [Chlamydiota bacterium]MBI3276316.1 PTS sugar transporter subunit IIA [Chlamydiota bacterium]